MALVSTLSSDRYLNYNPLLKSDLSKEISFHKWEAYKNISLVALAYIAFLAIAAIGIWYAAFFAIEALPVILALNTIGLNITHRIFSQPHKLAADHHFEAKGFEEKVFEKIKHLSPLKFSRNSSLGARSVAASTKKRLTPLFARYTVLHEESNLRLSEISRVFHQSAKYNRKRVPLNYQALKQNYSSPRLTASQAAWHLNHLATYKANKAKILDEYLERRVEQIFLAYNAENPYRYGSFKEIGRCYNAGDLLTRRYLDDDSFFLFNPKSCVISRKALLDAHKNVARHILEEHGSMPNTYFSRAEWEEINQILTQKQLTKRSRISVDEELSPFIEKVVNKQFIQLFSDHDAYSLRKTLSNYLFLGDYPKQSLVPKGVIFTSEELLEAGEIKKSTPYESFHLNERIKEIVEAKIRAYRV
ncbi:MAG: hypothetical protein FJZ59_03695 [Chlamydiae bacterium]|nr:hypothetical protein [Chlamydiota bacterium]